MLKLIGCIPDKVYLACSGGVDSMFVLDFLLKGRRNVELLYFNHKTKHGEAALYFLREIAYRYKLTLHVEEYLSDVKTEESWRNARYAFFKKFNDRPIITCHHLNDNIETYLLSTIKGTPKFIPYQRDNIIRPFLLCSKQTILEKVKQHSIDWIEDESNQETHYSRNKLRNLVVPVLKEINPGLEKTFYQKCFDKYRKEDLV